MPDFCNTVPLFLFAVKCLKNTPAFFAERLHNAMKVGVCDKLHKLTVWGFFKPLVQLLGRNCAAEGITFFSGQMTNRMQLLL